MGRNRTGATVLAPGGRATIEVSVDSPYGHAPDRVRRIVDIIDDAERRGRWDRGQVAAARRWRAAWEVVQSGSLAASDAAVASRGRGKGSHGAPPPERILIAAADLRVARCGVGEMTEAVLVMVLGEGRTVREACGALLPCRSDREREEAERGLGSAIRLGLTWLAREWGYAEHPRIRADRADASDEVA